MAFFKRGFCVFVEVTFFRCWSYGPWVFYLSQGSTCWCSFLLGMANQQNFLPWLPCPMWFWQDSRKQHASILLPAQWMVGRRGCLPFGGRAVPFWMVFVVPNGPSVVPKGCGIFLCRCGCQSKWVCPYMWWDILFFVHRDTILYENRDGAIVRLFPTLISKLGKLLKELAFAAGSDSWWNGWQPTCRAVLVPPLATPTHFVGNRMIDRPTILLWCMLR